MIRRFPLGFWTNVAPRLAASPRLAPFLTRLLRATKFQYVEIALPQRIGHLALEPDCFLRESILDGHSPHALLIEPPQGFANQTLASYLARKMTVLRRNEASTSLERYFWENGFTVQTAPYVVAMYDTARCHDVYRRWGKRPPLFRLTEADRRFTEQSLQQLGVPPGSWFVCIHARDGGFSPSDESWHSHRNVDIDDFGAAIDLIASRGGWCVRMGGPSMNPMAPRDRCIDYALSPLKSDRLDIGLAAGCRFFLGCASGLYNVAAMFGQPSALANMSPLSGAYSQGVGDLAIPQRLRDLSGRLVPFDEVFASDVADLRLAEEFFARDLTPVNVEANEIAEMASEMLDVLDGTVTYSPEDKARQERFRAFLRPGHYAFGTGSKLGRDYLRRHMAAA